MSLFARRSSGICLFYPSPLYALVKFRFSRGKDDNNGIYHCLARNYTLNGLFNEKWVKLYYLEILVRSGFGGIVVNSFIVRFMNFENWF